MLEDYKNALKSGQRAYRACVARGQSPYLAVLVEVGFINTDADNELFDSRFDEIARAIADGILESM